MPGPYEFPRVFNGAPVDADLWYNPVADAVVELGTLYQQPYVRLFRAAAHPVPNNTIATIPMDTQDFGSGGGWAVSPNPTRYTPTVAGIYLVLGGIGYAANTTGIRTAQFGKNGTSIPGTQGKIMPVTGGIATGVAARATLVSMNGTTDYLELIGFQNSGADLNTSTESENYPSLSAVLLARL